MLSLKDTKLGGVVVDDDVGYPRKRSSITSAGSVRRLDPRSKVGMLLCSMHPDDRECDDVFVETLKDDELDLDDEYPSAAGLCPRLQSLQTYLSISLVSINPFHTSVSSVPSV